MAWATFRGRRVSSLLVVCIHVATSRDPPVELMQESTNLQFQECPLEALAAEGSKSPLTPKLMGGRVSVVGRHLAPPSFG